ncbi:MAG: twin-arginine translocation signal domain-containing protein, partial [Candidatus Rokuibacteriota bacterium]
MQPEWLKRYFEQHDGPCPHVVAMNEPGEGEDGVSRRDFVKTGFVAGMAAGMAAGAVAHTAGEAEAQGANP